MVCVLTLEDNLHNTNVFLEKFVEKFVCFFLEKFSPAYNLIDLAGLVGLDLDLISLRSQVQSLKMFEICTFTQLNLFILHTSRFQFLKKEKSLTLLDFASYCDCNVP